MIVIRTIYIPFISPIRGMSPWPSAPAGSRQPPAFRSALQLLEERFLRLAVALQALLDLHHRLPHGIGGAGPGGPAGDARRQLAQAPLELRGPQVVRPGGVVEVERLGLVLR